jgi:hypothetical protein
MCDGNRCGPLCDTQGTSCNVKDQNIFPIGGTPNLINPVPGDGISLNATDPNCPPNCCSSINEKCMRLNDNTGNRVYPDEEIMLVFGGISFLETLINGVNVIDACESH